MCENNTNKTINQVKDYVKKKVEPFLDETSMIEYDGCHKIYMLDESTVPMEPPKPFDKSSDIPLLRSCYKLGDGEGEVDRETAKNILADWFTRSCGLEFINHVDEETFTNCIEQGDLEVIKIYSQFDEE